MKKLLFLLVALFSATTLFAQPKHLKTDDEYLAKKKEIEKLKIAYITANLELTEEQAQKFWPIYNEFKNKLYQTKATYRTNDEWHTDFSQKNDEELKKMMTNRFDMKQQELKIEMEYHQKLLQVLSVKQVARLYQTEQEFKRDLIKQLKNPNHGFGPGNSIDPRK